MSKKSDVVIVGGGFAGINCAHTLIADRSVHVTLIDKNNYSKFTPLLYQVTSSALSPDTAALPLRRYFAGKANIDIKMANVVSMDPKTSTLTTDDGQTYQADTLVLAAGNRVNFFKTPGAAQFSFPLYTLKDAERLRSRLIGAFENADKNPDLIEQGILNFVIVGAGPTGTEVAGAIADLLHFCLPQEFNDLALKKAKIYIVNHKPTVLNAFALESQHYAIEVLRKRGITLLLGMGVEKVNAGDVELSNGNKISTKTVVWAGGLQAPLLADHCGIRQGHAGRVMIRSDLTVEGFPNLYVIGDMAVMPGDDGQPLPQLASVAKQAGVWAARNILAQRAGHSPSPFQYKDKGILAMIGKGAAIAELGKKRREYNGFLAYLTWVGIHIALLPSLFQKVQALIDWTLNYFGRPTFQILDGSDSTHIDWDKK